MIKVQKQYRNLILSVVSGRGSRAFSAVAGNPVPVTYSTQPKKNPLSLCGGEKSTSFLTGNELLALPIISPPTYTVPPLSKRWRYGIHGHYQTNSPFPSSPNPLH